MAEVAESGLGAEAFLTPLNEHAFDWAVGYWTAHGAAPTPPARR